MFNFFKREKKLPESTVSECNVVHIDAAQLLYDVEHPEEAMLRKAKALSVELNITLSEALDLIKLKKLKEIELNSRISSRHNPSFYIF